MPVTSPDRRKLPRRYARIPAPERIAEWCEEEIARLPDPKEATGRHPVLRWKVLEYLACNPGLEPEDLELRVNRDKHWRDRARRTAAEKLAYRALILWDDRTRHMTCVWVMPREEALGGN